MVDTKERILAAGLDLFSAHAFAEVRTKALAEAAQVNEVTLFRIFGSKDSIYRAVYDRYVMRPSEVISLEDLDGDPSLDLPIIAAAIGNLVRQNVEVVSMNFKNSGRFPDLDEDLRSQPEILQGLVQDYLSRLKRKGIIEGQTDSLAQSFVDAAFGGAIHLIHQNKGDRIPEFTRIFALAYARGISVNRA